MSPLLGHVGGPTLAPIQIGFVTLIVTAYTVRVRTLAAEGRPVARWRAWSFAAGVAVLVAGMVSPLAHVGTELVSAHMAQHLLIGDLAALLLVLGLTGPVLKPLLAIRWLGWLRTLAHPLIALPLWALNLYVWHIPVLYQAALTSDLVHGVQHASFIGLGVMMWMPLLGPLPTPSWFGLPAKIGYVVGVRLIGTVMGNVFMWSSAVFYPDYGPGQERFGIDSLADQGTAGVVMMIEGGLVTLGLIAWLFLRWAQQDTERQELVDLAGERGVPLSDARAERAVSAGQGGRLAERIRDA